ncbi:type 4a pilus biogenesis protein PilO [Deinococcus sp. KNUC1210]|uniref:type 4a pilus biogenesis protein PilO n=1 Tax=Deinococcus sp. KNUC1210 TaxID=2917691 RepID=UPI001EF009E0|nr:type 4a pilus biogenesis protein PilO [Deinococcus sp. KNUC1210]ULH16672.1 type 4a pilus biogenesis protein PilO [Deinococcus sp. KNUC1210]
MSVKLSPRDTFLVVLLVCILGIVAWYFLYYQARNQEISDAQFNLDTRNATLLTYRSAQSALPALRTEVAGLQVQSDAFFQALPKTANIGSVIAAIRQTVAVASGELNSVTVSSAATPGLPTGVRPIALNLGVSARFQPTFQMLRSLETMSRFSNVSNVSLALPAPDSTDPKLNTSMVLTVYTFDPSQAGLSGTPGAPAAAPSAPATTPGGVR